MSWWGFTRAALEALTCPEADIAASDRRVQDLSHGSRILNVIRRAVDVIAIAWRHSHVRAAALLIANGPEPHDPQRAFRLRGWIAVVSGAMILMFNALKPVPLGPLVWMAPAAIAIAGLMTMLLAAPLARAAADRRSRQSLP